MSAEQLARAVEVIQALLELLDRKWLQISWHDSDRQVVDEARAFLEARLT